MTYPGWEMPRYPILHITMGNGGESKPRCRKCRVVLDNDDQKLCERCQEEDDNEKAYNEAVDELFSRYTTEDSGIPDDRIEDYRRELDRLKRRFNQSD